MREGSGFIGKDADDIDEAALFHHMQGEQGDFFSFILDIWKSQTASFVDYRSTKLETLNRAFWDDYSSENKIDDKIKELNGNPDTLQKELAKLNVFYNSLHLSNLDEDRIKFGDVFRGLNNTGKSDGNYWLNITAHCDCLHPENIKNSFYFILGAKEDIATCLRDGDAGFNSYLKIDNQVVAIRWGGKPTILNISNNKMSEKIVAAIDGAQTEHKLQHVGTLKETYAQRMANNSFSFAMRVGIDFAKLV